jgi:hypothetical protein
MVSDIEIYRSANALICQYGDGAAFHAAMRADALLEAGDLDGLAIWKRIIRAIDELTSKETAGTVQ